MNCKPIPEREAWYITDRKPTICTSCAKKAVRKAVLCYPLEEDWHNDKFFLVGCIQDFLIDRNWGFRHCDAAFFKDTPRNKAALDGLVPHQWPKE